MSKERPCKKGRKRHRLDSDGYCYYCNLHIQPQFGEEELYSGD